ncbi:hypothetical protein Nepgr_013486 [Nepenthes gracilis]|uniref:Uncharacterized protein n=1 Tax=Nepenthes gracilis TaxID=150966 RepID=A0AAD3SHK5_NEPGR|nr:hypothetical protein Nepgr_013486 [Nepenthes gracilis]
MCYPQDAEDVAGWVQCEIWLLLMSGLVCPFMFLVAGNFVAFPCWHANMLAWGIKLPGRQSCGLSMQDAATAAGNALVLLSGYVAACLCFCSLIMLRSGALVP